MEWTAKWKKKLHPVRCLTVRQTYMYVLLSILCWNVSRRMSIMDNKSNNCVCDEIVDAIHSQFLFEIQKLTAGLIHRNIIELLLLIFHSSLHYLLFLYIGIRAYCLSCINPHCFFLNSNDLSLPGYLSIHLPIYLKLCMCALCALVRIVRQNAERINDFVRRREYGQNKTQYAPPRASSKNKKTKQILNKLNENTDRHSSQYMTSIGILVKTRDKDIFHKIPERERTRERNTNETSKNEMKRQSVPVCIDWLLAKGSTTATPCSICHASICTDCLSIEV